MKKYLKYYEKGNKFRLNFTFPSFTRKQKFSLGFVIFCTLFLFVKSQSIGFGGGGSINYKNYEYKPLYEVVQADKAPVAAWQAFEGMFPFLSIVKNCLEYIVKAQTSSIKTIAGSNFGFPGMFNYILSGLTIFACIACAYKIVKHFIDTERHDNIKSIFGYFSYLGVLVLFMFSSTIVNKVAGLNSGVNVKAIENIGAHIGSELDRQYQKDFDELKVYIEKQNQKIEDAGMFDKVSLNIEKYGHIGFNYYGGNTIKYGYFSFFGLILTAVLAIPAFILTFMVKVLLSVMIAGTKIVFLLAFIPGFENVWKTFMLNMLNVLLWVPIFNAIITFIIAIVDTSIVANSMNTGQIVWLTIVAIICAYQSISLTTSAAQSLISGAGAGMAGAMGSLSSMNGGSMVAGGVTAVAGIGAIAATGGAATSAIAGKTAQKLSKD